MMRLANMGQEVSQGVYDIGLGISGCRMIGQEPPLSSVAFTSPLKDSRDHSRHQQ